MSKSKGNIIDPLDLIDRYGCDALRFTLTALAAQGRDVKLAESRVEGYRNFATKLWNAARYAEMNGCAYVSGFDPAICKLPVNRWIVGALAAASRETEAAIDGFKFNDAANALYQFAWGSFCDWYIEFTKPILLGDDDAAKDETRATMAWVLGEILHLLHPIMPFISEEIWEQLAGADAGRLITARWPNYPASLSDQAATAEMDWVVRLISSVRAVRSEMNVPASAKLTLLIKDAAPATLARLAAHRELVLRLARLESVEPLAGETPEGAIQVVVDEATLLLPLGGIMDFAQERGRLAKEIARLDGEIDKSARKLGNQQFIAKAKPEVVEEQRERLADAEQARDKLRAALERLQPL